MATIKNKLLAIVYVIFSLLLTWKTYFMFTGMVSAIDDTLIVTLFWIGYIVLFATLAGFMPYRIATANQDVDIMKAVKGIFWFFSGYVVSIILTYIYTTLATVYVDPTGTVTMLDGEVGLIMWFGYYLVVVLLTVVVPVYVTMPEGA